MKMSLVPPLPFPSGELPLFAGDPAERADAARNRRRVLEAAQRLFDRDGVGCTSMDAIAAEAGVGKGTLFRRFGDRASLLQAILTESEQAFQDQMIRGEPPLGPGAPPVERLIAFGEARLDLLEQHAALMAGAESGQPGAYLRSAVWAFYHLHVALLLREGAPELDPDLGADLLLSGLSAQLFLHQRVGVGVPLATLKQHWALLARRILGPAPEERAIPAAPTTSGAARISPSGRA
jgi:AcrR family transcriptional regulator